MQFLFLTQYIHIITTVTWSDASYHVEWIFPDQSITQEVERRV